MKLLYDNVGEIRKYTSDIYDASHTFKTDKGFTFLMGNVLIHEEWDLVANFNAISCTSYYMRSLGTFYNQSYCDLAVEKNVKPSFLVQKNRKWRACRVCARICVICQTVAVSRKASISNGKSHNHFMDELL